tara:strand:+ start:1232 stop:1846 length:615 start_codon:yes stop_codon:yes gene_type:complete
MKKAGIIMIIGSLLLLGLFQFPLWTIMLGAPQYPEPLGMHIFVDGIKSVNEFDVQNINGLNHYIGMKTLPEPHEMWEFQIFPIILVGIVSLGVLVGLLMYFNKISYTWALVWFIVMSILGVLGMYDFNLWMLDYGTNLDPNAIMKLADADGNPMSYKPPLLGSKDLLNFQVQSLPNIGGYLMFSGMGLTFVAFLVGWKTKPSRS